ncbi:lipoate--protein ligase family protein [Salisediminibacterium halotolerans]|uniref:Octanoyl-[GcvH]:protein N-octanoyltransferase n=1 Tax=Salisediminibacterium halotolerans TaxID=517425 RepID=A0A1H9QVI5_9BACI|nr:octanoyl-[GcvH]:protein N-octanoyltransferase [Salisediminibacterium haloalkalitolerans]
MNTAELYQNQWYWLDETESGKHLRALHSFAMDDTLCRLAGTYESTGFARAWVHDNTVVLGIQDSRLPHIYDGIGFLQEAGYDVIVRNSGGLAVVLDPGIYNLSLIFPENRLLTIERGYELQVELIRSVFPELEGKIADGEIKESYCPGRYDLSVHGQKFAGISQRRVRGGIAVQIYLAVSGSGAERAELIRSFYSKAVADKQANFSYPHIQPERMASLEEITGQPLTNAGISERILNRIHQFSGNLSAYKLNAVHEPTYDAQLQRIIERNEKLSLV